MTISPELKEAIGNYFKTKRNSKGFFPDYETKKKCIDDLTTAVKQVGYHAMIIAGVIWINDGETTREFTSRNWWIGKQVNHGKA